jgi:chemotaxis signal transduction protein
MSDRTTKVEVMSQAGQALQDLLQTLLSEVPEDPGPPRARDEAPPGPQASAPAAKAELNDPRELPIQQTAPCRDGGASVRPEWAADGMKVLIVKVGDLSMAVPLVCLNGISPAAVPGEVLHLPGQPAWHRGVATVRDRRTVLVDPAALLELGAERKSTAYLLLIDDGRFALEVDGMEEPLSVTLDEVRWRQPGRGREWVLGALPDRACMLLDVDALAGRLQQDAENRHDKC